MDQRLIASLSDAGTQGRDRCIATIVDIAQQVSPFDVCEGASCLAFSQINPVLVDASGTDALGASSRLSGDPPNRRHA